MAPLLAAADRPRGGERIMQMLLMAGARVNAVDRSGDTSLHKAVAASNKGLTELLLQHGADTNFQTTRGRTALHTAAVHGMAPFVALLLHHGADPKLQDQTGATARDDAARKGEREVLTIIDDFRPSPPTPAAQQGISSGGWRAALGFGAADGAQPQQEQQQPQQQQQLHSQPQPQTQQHQAVSGGGWRQQAQPTSSSDAAHAASQAQAAATKAFEEGERLYERQRWMDALPAFEKALTLQYFDQVRRVGGDVSILLVMYHHVLC
eukprot:SAG11_NODE_1091_length_5910_cov_4.332817_9_plen_265_part_00